MRSNENCIYFFTDETNLQKDVYAQENMKNFELNENTNTKKSTMSTKSNQNTEKTTKKKQMNTKSKQNRKQTNKH